MARVAALEAQLSLLRESLDAMAEKLEGAIQQQRRAILRALGLLPRKIVDQLGNQ